MVESLTLFWLSKLPHLSYEQAKAMAVIQYEEIMND